MNRGVVAIEFALVALMLSTILVGIVEMSAAWRIRHILQAAAREGARVASLTPNLEWQDPKIISMVEQMIRNSGLNVDGPDGDSSVYEAGVVFEILDPERGTLAPGDPVTVNVAYNYEPPVIGLLPGFDTIQFDMHSTMRYQLRSASAPGPGGGGEPPEDPAEADEDTPGGGYDSDPFAYHPFDTRDQGNAGVPCMRDPHGYDPDRPNEETGNQGRPHGGCVE